MFLVFTLKVTFKIAAGDVVFLRYFSEKTRPAISRVLYAKQTIHMKYQTLFTCKIKIRMSSAAFVTSKFKGNNTQQSVCQFPLYNSD